MPASAEIPLSKRRVGRPKDPAKQAAILQAARECFVAQGYTGTSMDAIAAQAGVSKLTIYSHYTNKDALFQAVIHALGQDLLILRNPEEMTGLPRAEALLCVARDLLSLWLQPEVMSLHRIMAAEAVHQPRSNRLMIEAGPQLTKRQLAMLLERHGDDYDFGDVGQVANHFRALLRGELYISSLLRLRSRPTPAEIEAHATDVVRLFLRAHRRI